MSNKYSDKELEQKIDELKQVVKLAIEKHDLWSDDSCTFRSYAEHYDDEPSQCPCVLVLCVDESAASALNAYLSINLGDEIADALENTEFSFELHDHTTVGFYVANEESELAEAFRDYFEWNWICDLIKPDYSILYEEIFDRFHKNPDDLYKLSHRKFEEFLDVVFLNNGYKTILGSGGNDGGVDLRLYSNELVGESVTLVQAKRYKPENPIGLESIQALTAVVEDQKANKGLFVTTSRYLPCAEKFAARQKSRINLATSEDVAKWSSSASCRIIRDKSKMIEIEQVKKLLQGGEGTGLEGKIFHSNIGYNMINNFYAMVVKETNGVALLVELPKKILSHDGYEQRGIHIPDTSVESLYATNKLHIFRAKKKFNENNQFECLWGEKQRLSLWNKVPNHFDLCD